MVGTWAAGTAVAVVAGVVGYFVVLRGETFAAHALPQGAFAGAAGASAVGLSPVVGAGVFSLLGAAAMALLARRGRRDVATALALVLLLSTGALFLGLSTEYAPEVYSLLFGQLLGVSLGDVPAILLVSALCLALAAIVFRPLLAWSALGEASILRGRRSRAVDAAFLVLVTLATTAAVPVVGAFLMFSLVTAPAAAARVVVARPLPGVAAAVGLSLGIVWASVALGYLTGWPVGFFVGLAGALVYAAGRLLARARA